MTGSAIKPLPPGSVVAVRGISLHQDVAATVKEGDPMLLVHEYTNAIDPYAVRIETGDGRQVGWVPRASQLNERLVAGRPGRTFNGVVAQVLGGTDGTIGLRVRVVSLAAEGDPTFGASLMGLRHTGDGYEGTHTVDVDESADQTDEQDVQYVFARTGRRIGRFLEVSGNLVFADVEGRRASYPAHVVEVRADEVAAPAVAS